jgi:hypothetical protein
MIKKDLLVVLNIFGISSNEEKQIETYMHCIDSILWHIKKNKLQESVRFVVSSVMSSQRCVEAIKQKFGDALSIFSYEDRYTVQVSCNKTILAAIEEFQEEYEGYFYISSGIILPDIEDLFPRIISKNNSGEFGIIQLQVDVDRGYEWLGKGSEFNSINFSEDYQIPVGNHCNFHIAVINKSLKDYYGHPITDVHGLCCMEAGVPYTAYALRKKYMLLGNSECIHFTSFDSFRKMININKPMVGHNQPGVNCGLLWGRCRDDFLLDKEGIDSGLGYYPGPIANNVPDWNGVVLPHNREKYDENSLSLDERLKEAVKRRYYTNNLEIDYKTIPYRFIK